MRLLLEMVREGLYAAVIRWLAPRRLGAAQNLTLYSRANGQKIRVRISRDYSDG